MKTALWIITILSSLFAITTLLMAFMADSAPQQGAAAAMAAAIAIIPYVLARSVSEVSKLQNVKKADI
jgi:hypothetical protein